MTIGRSATPRLAARPHLSILQPSLQLGSWGRGFVIALDATTTFSASAVSQIGVGTTGTRSGNRSELPAKDPAFAERYVKRSICGRPGLAELARGRGEPAGPLRRGHPVVWTPQTGRHGRPGRRRGQGPGEALRRRGPATVKALVERSGMTMNVGAVQEQHVQPVRPTLLMLQGGVAFALLMGCVTWPISCSYVPTPASPSWRFDPRSERGARRLPGSSSWKACF